MDLNEVQSLSVCLCYSSEEEIKGDDRSIGELETCSLILCQRFIL